MAVLTEVIRFHGHPEVRATHARTIELTREDYLTANGDCIVGVEADRGLAELSEEFKKRVQSGFHITVSIQAGGESFRFGATGDHRLLLSSEVDMVIRKSGYICGRTLAVRSDAAAIDIPRAMVRSLRSRATEGKFIVEVEA
jgi:hypothetical protein